MRVGDHVIYDGEARLWTERATGPEPEGQSERRQWLGTVTVILPDPMQVIVTMRPEAGFTQTFLSLGQLYDRGYAYTFPPEDLVAPPVHTEPPPPMEPGWHPTDWGGVEVLDPETLQRRR